MKDFEYYINNKAKEEFKKDLFIELGIEDHPKKDKLFLIAWNWGREYGYKETFGIAKELVGLIKD